MLFRSNSPTLARSASLRPREVMAGVPMRMPLAVPFALILWLPGVIYLAEIVYRWISRNRHLIGKLFGCKGACAIVPARRRNNESVP